MNLVLVLAGSALGGVARFWLSGGIARRVGETFPWGTLAVNASGALAIGLVAALALGSDGLWTPQAWHFAVYGFLGSYTTVSSFSLQTLLLARDGDWRRAMANVLLSLALCLAAVVLGWLAGLRLAAAA